MTEVSAVEITSTPSRPSNGETLINLVLDETGSMMSCYDSTISSVNDYLGSQKNVEGVAKVSLFTFSDKGHYGVTNGQESNQNIRSVCENVPVASVEFLNRQNYRPNGGTNLYDAIGHTIRKVEGQLSPLQAIPNVLVVIVTDGGENASREYTLSAIQTLIKEKEAEGWTFIYLGANQDAWRVAQSFGLSQGQAMTYDTNAMDSTMSTLASATTVYRKSRTSGLVAHGTVERNFFSDQEKK